LRGSSDAPAEAADGDGGVFDSTGDDVHDDVDMALVRFADFRRS
jgi:hypothetical protein